MGVFVWWMLRNDGKKEIVVTLLVDNTAINYYEKLMSDEEVSHSL